MIILLTIIAIVVAGIPLAAVVLVTVASRREENAGSIADRAPGRMERAARRLLAFHATGIGRPTCRGRARGRGRGPGARRSADDDRRRSGRSYSSGGTGGTSHAGHSGATGRTYRPGGTGGTGHTDRSGDTRRTNRGDPTGGPGHTDLVGAGPSGPVRRP